MKPLFKNYTDVVQYHINWTASHITPLHRAVLRCIEFRNPDAVAETLAPYKCSEIAHATAQLEYWGFIHKPEKSGAYIKTMVGNAIFQCLPVLPLTFASDA